MCTHIVDFQDRKIYLRSAQRPVACYSSGKASRERHIEEAVRVYGVHFPDPGPAGGGPAYEHEAHIEPEVTEDVAGSNERASFSYTVDQRWQLA